MIRAESNAAASLRFLRMLLLLCVLVPVVLFVAFGAYRWQQIHLEAEARLDRALRIANEHALKVLETNEAMLGHILDLASAAGDTQPHVVEGTLQLQLASLTQRKPQVSSIWVIDGQGRTIASSRASAAPDVSVAEMDFFRFHQQNGIDRTFFSEVLAGPDTGERVFGVSRARKSGDGQLERVASIAIDPDYFNRFHSDLSANEPGLAITMFRDDGLVYSRWPSVQSQPTRMGQSSEVLRRVIAGERSGAVRAISSLDRNARLIFFQQVGSYPIYLGTGRELAAIQEAWLREMAFLGAFSLVPVLGLIVAALAAMKRARQSLAAMKRLREEADARFQVEEALRQAQKMEALGRLTGGVAHDFNNALMVISGNLQIMRLSHPQVQGRQTEAITRAVESAANLTRQLLAFSRRQALTPQVLRLQDRLPLMRDLLMPVLGAQVPLTIDVASGTAPVRLDIAELELALINLAVNAKDAMPGGGTLLVSARNEPLPAPLEGPGVVIEVSDTGSGIPPDVVAKVFEPFFTTKPVGEGTGLGLSQVYGLCERSGGVARLSSAVGVGTCVRLHLPAVSDEVSAIAVADVHPTQLFGLRVVLVEDNADVAGAIQPVLEMQGCSVVHFDGAQQAAQWMSQNSSKFDLLLTDVVMPGDMDGLALASYVRGTFPDVPIVVMTGYAEHMAQIEREGFALLAKPWTGDSLARMLELARRKQASGREAVS